MNVRLACSIVTIFSLSVALGYSGPASAALIQYNKNLEVAPDAPSYASNYSGYINATWDTATETFVAFEIVVDGFGSGVFWGSTWGDNPLGIGVPGGDYGSTFLPDPHDSRYLMPKVFLADVTSPCCGMFLQLSSGLVYFRYDGYKPERVEGPPGLYLNDFTETAIAINALNQGFPDFVIFDYFTYSPGDPAFGVQVYGAPLLQATFIPVPAAAWLFGSALGLLGWMRRKTA